MFKPKKTILVLSQKNLKVMAVALGKEPQATLLEDQPWTEATLTGTLKEIAGKIKVKTVRVLLTEDAAYSLELTLPTKEHFSREQILSHLKAQIPEELHDQDWDFKVEPAAESPQAGQKILAFAPVEQLWHIFSAAVTQAGLKVEAVEPEPIAQKRHPDPVIGLALKTDLKGKDEQVLNLKPTPMEPKSADSVHPADQVTQDPAEASVTPLPAAQPDAVSLKPASPLHHQAPPAPVIKPRSKKTYLLIALAVALVVGLIGGGMVISQKAFAPKPTPSPSPILAPSPTPLPTPEATQSATLSKEDLADYKVQILNGSGVAGEAGKVEALLKAEGFSEITPGNAENFDYEETEVHLDQDVDDQVFDVVERALEDQFTVTRYPTPMTDQAEYDIVIIVGTRKEE